MLYKNDIGNDATVGRLGNKLFVMAAAIGWSERTDKEYFIGDWVHSQLYPKINYGTQNNKLDYIESDFHFKEIPDLEEDFNLVGYFQSEKYFEHCKDKIREAFYIDCELLKNYITTIGKKVSSIHIRRGDYVNLKDYHPLCSMEYYTEAIKIMKSKGHDKFLIFSDDIEWCKLKFIGDEFEFSEGRSEITDMYLMSSCHSHIIANSSFSWWGAWLNENEDKKVIAPKQWFGDLVKHNTKDLIPKGWYRV